MEHVEEDGKAMLYLVFEYLDQDLKGFMDLTGRGPANPLKKEVVQDFMYQLWLGCAQSTARASCTATSSPGASSSLRPRT